MLKELIRRVLREGPGGSDPGPLHVVPITSCLEPHGNDVVLVFARNEDCPGHVMKMVRSSAYNSKIEREGRVLVHLGSRPVIGALLPPVVRQGRINGNAFMIQRGVRGESLFRILLGCRSDARAQRLLLDAVGVLARLGRVSPPEGAGVDPSRNSMACDWPELLRRTGPGLSRERLARVEESARRIRELEGNWFLHGDFWPTNILIGEDGEIVGIIDWEFAAPTAPWPSDIGWFLINAGYTLAMRKDPSVTLPEAFRRVFFGSTEGETRILSEVARDYFTRLGLDPGLMRHLLEVTLMQLAQRELLAYGRHRGMDEVCAAMLAQLQDNPDSFRIR
jgi:aminoglycoside phosphotransferase (APT) family kinase protein